MTDNLKTVEGQITAINYEKRGLAVKDREGIIHSIYWMDPIKMVNRKGEPLKQYWFTKITIELDPSGDKWWVIAHEYFQKPADWPQQSRKDGGNYDPLRDKRIAFQGVLNAAIATIELGTPFLNEGEIVHTDVAYTVLETQKIYLKALDEYLEKGTGGIIIPSSTSP